jgi:hypothetical protein
MTSTTRLAIKFSALIRLLSYHHREKLLCKALAICVWNVIFACLYTFQEVCATVSIIINSETHWEKGKVNLRFSELSSWQKAFRENPIKIISHIFPTEYCSGLMIFMSSEEFVLFFWLKSNNGQLSTLYIINTARLIVLSFIFIFCWGQKKSSNIWFSPEGHKTRH